MALPKPVEKQREVVCLPASGHQVVLGTAGSGKTTMAILRAAYLSDPALPDHGPTLLLTYNRALGTFIRSIAAPELVNVRVEHAHKFARGYLNARGCMTPNAIVRGPRREVCIRAAIDAVRARYRPHPFFDRPLNFFSDEIAWLGGHGITSADDYAATDRVGRAEARLERTLRPAMWEIREEYRRLRADRGFQYDWDDLASAVTEALEHDPTPRRYKHIVIDEGQDLSPEMLRAVSKAVPLDGSITFFADVAQQIYGHRMSWRAAGLNPRAVWKFSHNYRNTKEIAELGLAIARMPYYAGAQDMVAPSAPAAAGPKPTLVHFGDPAAELPFIAAQAERLAETQSVAILTRSVREADMVRRLLKRPSTDLRAETWRWQTGPHLYLGTLHSGKGLEFDSVLLPHMSAEHMPDPAHVNDWGVSDAEAFDGRLLYVGVTRARRTLIISYTGERTRLLPNNPDLYVEVAR